MWGIKIPKQEFALKMQGGLCARRVGGGAYLQDTTVIVETCEQGTDAIKCTTSIRGLVP